jgi:hypothetical protein
MGSQRPLDTVRGVVNAVWLQEGTAQGPPPRIWTHHENSGVDDLDLPVITTNSKAGRRFDFHELYWAHLMSETRAVAVLLWLFELARTGPYLRPSIWPVYWAALTFLSVLVLSVSLLAVQIIVHFAAMVGHATNYELLSVDQHSLAYVLFGAIAVTSVFAALVATRQRSFSLAGILIGIGVCFAALFWFESRHEQTAEWLTPTFLPFAVAAIVANFTMGRWGLLGLLIVLSISWIVGVLAAVCFHPDLLKDTTRYPWNANSFWSSIASFYVIGLYLAANAAFLQPSLGDAARYFRNSPANVAVRREIRRQAVKMLETLHLSGNYDRIVIVAHSLGTVVAYDMLRAYYSRVKDTLPAPDSLDALGTEFSLADTGRRTATELCDKARARKAGRAVIAQMAALLDQAKMRIGEGRAKADDAVLKAWLVTDFVTLGSPLTHALYLMCRGSTEKELGEDFERRVQEREFPVCPPRMTEGDNRLTFENPRTKKRQFHHGGQFALTRWTNLYFPASELLWGDPVGGEVGLLFGDRSRSNIADVPVYTNRKKARTWLAHIRYWDLGYGNDAPHIRALKSALDLGDTGTANAPEAS